MRNHSAQSATRMWTLPCVLVVALSVVATCPASAQVSFSNLASTSFKPYTPGAVKSGDAVMTAHYNPSQMLRLTLGLQPPHVAEEQEFLQQLQIKGKGGFHKFLSAEEWTKRFDYAPLPKPPDRRRRGHSGHY
jgi:hypothetical protein